MGFLEKFKQKTIADVVDSAKEKVTDTAKKVTQTHVDTILTLLPLAATACIIFGGSRDSGRSADAPTKTVINNYYYYGEGRVRKHVLDDHESGK